VPGKGERRERLRRLVYLPPSQNEDKNGDEETATTARLAAKRLDLAFA